MDKGSKLAVILYEKIIGSEWIGAMVKSKDSIKRDINVVFTLGLIHDGEANEEKTNKDKTSEENKSTKKKNSD